MHTTDELRGEGLRATGGLSYADSTGTPTQLIFVPHSRGDTPDLPATLRGGGSETGDRPSPGAQVAGGTATAARAPERGKKTQKNSPHLILQDQYLPCDMSLPHTKPSAPETSSQACVAGLCVAEGC